MRAPLRRLAWRRQSLRMKFSPHQATAYACALGEGNKRSIMRHTSPEAEILKSRSIFLAWQITWTSLIFSKCPDCFRLIYNAHYYHFCYSYPICLWENYVHFNFDSCDARKSVMWSSRSPLHTWPVFGVLHALIWSGVLHLCRSHSFRVDRDTWTLNNAIQYPEGLMLYPTCCCYWWALSQLMIVG